MAVALSVVSNAASADIIDEIKAKYAETVANARSACSGISGGLDDIKIAAGISTVASGAGTLAAGGALVTGVMKAKADREAEALQEGVTTEESRALYEKYKTSMTPQEKDALTSGELLMIAYEMRADLDKKSRTLGNVRTGLMIGASVTSAASTVSSAIGASQIDKLIGNMQDCDKYVNEIKMLKLSLLQEGQPETDPVVVEVSRIESLCTGFDIGNIRTIKGMLTGSAVVSGVGTLSGIAGSITSGIANSKKTRGDDSDAGKKKEKNLNLAANITAGITTGTSAASTVLSGVTLNKLKENSEVADKCGKAF
jgi:hypothetical protein